MKAILYTLLAASFIIATYSCNDPKPSIESGDIVKGELYKNKEVGWTIEIPKGWDIVSRDESDKRDQKGKEAIEQTGVKIDDSQLKNMISFKKDQFNLFTSTIEPYKEETPGDYAARCQEVNHLIYNTFVEKGIKADTSSGQESVNGLIFYTFSSTIYGPDNKVILNQKMFSRLMNGYDFSVNINYNSNANRDEMLNAFTNSTFK